MCYYRSYQTSIGRNKQTRHGRQEFLRVQTSCEIKNASTGSSLVWNIGIAVNHRHNYLIYHNTGQCCHKCDNDTSIALRMMVELIGNIIILRIFQTNTPPENTFAATVPETNTVSHTNNHTDYFELSGKFVYELYLSTLWIKRLDKPFHLFSL